MNLYHFVTQSKIDSIKRYGLCSPLALYEKDQDLFYRTTRRIYAGRTSKWLGKDVDSITNDDVIKYLDDNPGRKIFTSDAIFFVFLPLSEHHRKIQDSMTPCFQLTIDSNMLNQYKPILVGPGPDKKFTSWDTIDTTYFIDIVKKASLLNPSNDKLIFKRIPHLALRCYHIDYKDIESVEEIR